MTVADWFATYFVLEPNAWRKTNEAEPVLLMSDLNGRNTSQFSLILGKNVLKGIKCTMRTSNAFDFPVIISK